MAQMFPVRVLVETVRPQHCLSCSNDGQLVADTYAIISGDTQLNNMVDTVLSALGMPQLIADSRGKASFLLFFGVVYFVIVVVV